VLADGDAEVTVEGLEHDVDRLASGWARVGVGVGPGEVGDPLKPEPIGVRLLPR